MPLYPYQRTGVDFLATHKRAYLADEMGLGKTAQAVTASQIVRPKRTIVVCPASAVPNWRYEWSLWKGYGSPVFVSYSTLIRRRVSVIPDLVVLDEAHYCKSPSSKRTRAALGLAKKAEYAWLLSGTPMPNNPTELWPPMKYLWPKLTSGITRASQWRDKFCLCRPTEWGPKPYAVRNGEMLRGILSRIMLRRTLEDVGLELPPLRVEISRFPRDQAVGDSLAEYERAEMSEAAYTSTLRRILGSLKAPLIAKQIIEELDYGAYDKIVVLYYHRDVGAALREVFRRKGYPVRGFDGSSTQTQRQRAIEDFQQRDGRVFLAQQTAAGIAINLTAASEIVLVEPAWSPEDNEQAIKRIHRIGQDAPCRARIFAISGTLDEAIMGTLAQKTKMQTEVGF